jgi:hypothetical protein
MYIIGLIGAALVCVSYFMLQRGAWKPHSYIYLGCNLSASICLLASLIFPFEKNNLGPAIVQSMMIAISLYGFMLALKENKK